MNENRVGVGGMRGKEENRKKGNHVVGSGEKKKKEN